MRSYYTLRIKKLENLSANGWVWTCNPALKPWVMGKFSISIFFYKRGLSSDLPPQLLSTASLSIPTTLLQPPLTKMFALNGTVWNVLLNLQALFKVTFLHYSLLHYYSNGMHDLPLPYLQLVFMEGKPSFFFFSSQGWRSIYMKSFHND